ncbi:site-specific integrase [Chitinophaga sp. sic0106]|uniref:site-specific integrase n=1 Tax=Chitinophaga sp. sic0106 TaxID=2854785 RepID=UPI001C446CDD|nr:site-specific integrase [Chitinophaga sp. sic0106]MBV7531007.1 site-specific integrase [Chitinophaga sp. sic0106]
MRINKQLSILFLPEKSKIDANGDAPIIARITVQGIRREISLSIKIDPDQWDQSNENVNLVLVADKKKGMEVYQKVENTLNDLVSLYKMLTRGQQQVTADLLKNKYLGLVLPDAGRTETSASRTLCQTLNYKYSKLVALVKAGERSANTLKRWKVTKKKIRSFLDYTVNKNDIPLDQVGPSHPHEMLHFFLVHQKICKNTAMKYLKNTKELLSIAVLKGWIEKNPWAEFMSTYKQPKRSVLNLFQLITMYKKKLIGRLEHVRDVFLFACFTGYAFNEIQGLSKEMVFTGIDGKRWIRIDRRKTGSEECLPLLPIAAEILDRYKNDSYCVENNKLLPVKSYSNYNGYLKEVGDICDISFELSTHVARHTFAVTVCLENGIPIETISKMLGHKNIRTTQIYAQVSNANIALNMGRLARQLFSENGELTVKLYSEIIKAA